MQIKRAGTLVMAVASVCGVLGCAANALSAPGRLIATGQALPGLRLARDLGPLPPSQHIVVAITVRHDLPALYRAEWAMYDPQSPSYHHFLTPPQFRRRFAAPPGQVAAIRRFGTSHGLQLVNPDTLYDYVELYGTVGQVEATFAVRIDRFRSHSGARFFANTTAPVVPQGLGIDGVLGLETRDRYRAADRGANAAGVPRRTAQGQTQGGCQADPGGTGAIGSVCTGLFSPQALWRAYQMPAGPMRTADYGQGQTVAIIGDGQSADVIVALHEFEAVHGLPFVPVQVYHTDPGESAPERTLDDSERMEWELDTQAASGMAPEISQLRLYFGSSLSSAALTGAIGTWAGDPAGPLQADASLGVCEDSPATDPVYGVAQRADQALLIQAAAEGRTLFAAAGDTGTGGCPQVENGYAYSAPLQLYPAIDPNVTDVGGTVLYTRPDGERYLERAWDHSGGGPSRFLEQPPYQRDASPFLTANPCPGIGGDGTPFADGGHLCRAGADVSAESGDVTTSLDRHAGSVGLQQPGPAGANGYDTVDFCPEGASTLGAAVPACAYNGNRGRAYTDRVSGETGVISDHVPEWGTSLSAPLWAGMWARVQAHHDAVDPTTLAPDPARSLGLVNPLVYRLAQRPATSHDFHDIRLGGNPLPATRGWDYPTGWGSPDMDFLIPDADGRPGTEPISHVLPGSSDPAPITAAVPSGPACSYAFFDGTADGDYAVDFTNPEQYDQLDIVQGTLGLSPDHTRLRVVLTIRDLSKTVPPGGTALDYEFYWNNPPAQASSPNAVDVQVDLTGRVTYADGTYTSMGFTPNLSSQATGSFGSGPDGAIEVDVPLSDLGSPQLGAVLSAPSAYADVATGPPGAPITTLTADQDGPGNDYTLGQSTCIDPTG